MGIVEHQQTSNLQKKKSTETSAPKPRRCHHPSSCPKRLNPPPPPLPSPPPPLPLPPPPSRGTASPSASPTRSRSVRSYPLAFRRLRPSSRRHPPRVRAKRAILNSLGMLPTPIRLNHWRRSGVLGGSSPLSPRSISPSPRGCALVEGVGGDEPECALGTTRDRVHLCCRALRLPLPVWSAHGDVRGVYVYMSADVLTA